MAEVKLYELEISTVQVTVQGTSPLICHRFSEAAQEQIEGPQQGAAKRGKKSRDPQAEAELSLYRNSEGVNCFPAIAFKQAMVRAAKQCDMAMTDARTAFHVLGDLLPIRGSDPVARADRVVIGRGTTTIAYRPMFDTWEIDLTIRHNARAISAEQIINLLEVAGFGVGVGDWRPECSGSFGMFRIRR